MNHAMIRRLINKDWYLNRAAISAYVAVGLLAVAALGYGTFAAFYAGSILLITVLITIGIHLIMVTVIEERREHTLAFVMSLPVSAAEYTTAKILANVVILSIAWATLFVGTIAVIAGRATLPDGLIPFATVILLYLFAGYFLILTVALISESIGWTIGAMVCVNLFLQAVMYGVSNAPGISSDMKGEAIVWRQPITGLLAAEVAAIVVMLGMTFYLQSRKTDFL
jgi:ABC-2 type transport system permease protein